jgi:protein-tyrosine phosphatase
VYVHCALGYSRAASVVVGYLVSEGIAPDIERATEMLRRVRPQITLNGPYPAGLRRCFPAASVAAAGT